MFVVNICDLWGLAKYPANTSCQQKLYIISHSKGKWNAPANTYNVSLQHPDKVNCYKFSNGRDCGCNNTADAPCLVSLENKLTKRNWSPDKT